MQHEGIGEALVLAKLRGARRGAKIPERCDDPPVFGEHRGQLGPEPAGQRQHLGHLRRHAAQRDVGKQRDRWQRELLFLYEMRVQQPRHLPRRFTYGASLGYMGAGIAGFEIDFGYSPNFFETLVIDDDNFTFADDSNVTTLMFNILLGAPVGGQSGPGIRPYAVGGLGLIRTHVTEAGLFFEDLDSNDWGFNVGAGLHGFFSDNVGIRADDMVYNLSAKMLSPIQVRAKRHDFFWPVNYHGTEIIIRAMDKAGASSLVHYTTDMIYGHSVTYPMTEEHPVAPLGEYGLSKLKTEELAAEWRARGMRISLFRPRLIIGPGRLGILEKLFKLIDWNLPVPMIGSGKNPYQFVSVFDCAEAARLAWKAGVPNEAYNLGSLEPPPVRKLLSDLIGDQWVAASTVSAAPDGGTPYRWKPHRPASWTVVRNPGSMARRTGRRCVVGCSSNRWSAGRPPHEALAGTNRTRAPGSSKAGGDAAGSKRRNPVRPMRRQPPGLSTG